MGKRTPKLSVASAERRKVAISEDDWKRIEKAYGKKLSPEARKDIHEKTQKFVDRAEFEQNAEPVSDARDLITSIIETANALRSALERGDRDAHVHARTLVKKYLRKEAIKKRGLENVMAENANEGIDADDLLRAISSDMGQLIFASQDALRELNDTKDGGLKEGEAWDRWVNELGPIAKARGLPAGVRKDIDKQHRNSPFVELVWELQQFVPKDHRRDYSREAVAVAITTARQRNRVG